MQAVVNQEDFGFFPSTNDLKQPYGLHVPLSHQPLEVAPHFVKQMMQGDSHGYENEQASNNDFFSSFINSDFPIDVSFPMQHEAMPIMKGGFTRAVQSQAPIMQVAQSQNQSAYYPNKSCKAPTKFNGKRKHETVSSAPSQTQTPAQTPSTQTFNVGGTEQEHKRQKRRVKNREAAQLFRQRQKQHIRDLEAEVKGINDKNTHLTTQMEVMRAENTLVKEQLQYLRCFVLEGLKFAFPDQTKIHELEALFASFNGRSNTASKEDNHSN
jgi:hypothetical protein